MFQLGFVSAILGDRSLEQVFEFAAEAGYACVEVMCWPVGRADRRYAGVTHLDADHFSDADANKVVELQRRTGVAVSALGYYPNALSPHADEARLASEHIRRVIEAAGRLGVGMNTFIGRDPRLTVDANWPRMLDTWGPLVEFAQSHGVRIGIENCPMLFTADEWPGGKNLATSPAIWRQLFADLPSAHFGLNYDPSHMIWQQMDYLMPIVEFADRLFHIHAKDARIERARLNDIGILGFPNQYHTPKIPGLGDIDWHAFTDKLREIGYTGPVCVEVEDRSFEGSLELRQSALRQSAEYLRPLLAD
ncbi:MAG TPA: sugar phosphate isomerase/epimerase family protein [Pirellulaceae bacterium]|nr:sugar phosphate isomerase/epimerase family protein [Pirellulaceae bacterium]